MSRRFGTTSRALALAGALTLSGAAVFADATTIPATTQTASDWYPFTPTSEATPGELGMADWLEKPAGKHGRVTRRDDKIFYNGKPLKIWGLNLCFNHGCLPPKELADKRAAFYPKMGINSVRLHKFTESDYTADSIAEFDPVAIDRMDYQVAQFKNAGIFITLSAHFGNSRVGPADRKHVSFFDEIGSLVKPDKTGKLPKYFEVRHGAIYYSPELQDLHILQIVNLLKHKNPHTGMTYAEDPAVAFLEIINEQSSLFYTSPVALESYPAIRKMAGVRFTEWLLKKYGTEEALLKAWGGARAFEPIAKMNFPQSVAEKSILPIGNPDYWNPEALEGAEAYRRQRHIDTLQFLTMLMDEFHERYVKAVREAGYKGEILASNWWAGRAFSHYANLYSDYKIGLIDRHNYFGGGSKDGKKPFGYASMLAEPGSGLLSSGLQQVVDRPFMLSEWAHVFPNEWGAEGVAIIGAYGLGLQGWDASYLFQNHDDGGFSPFIGRRDWDAVAPQIIGLFPAVARAIYRGDVAESAVIASRNIHMPTNMEGKIASDETVKAGYDIKEYSSKIIPNETLAAGRAVVTFTDEYIPTKPADLAPYTKDSTIVASTNQLQWHKGQSKTDGFITINTPGTQALVGFAKDKPQQFADVTITSQNPFAAIYVTAPGPNDTIATSKKLLVTAMSRFRNADQKIDEENHLLAQGTPGHLIAEGVKATITLKNGAKANLVILDQDGKRTDISRPAVNGVITIDSGKDKTPYYLIELE